MPKKKKVVTSDRLEDLVELCHSLNVAEGAFNGDLEDACDLEAEMAKEQIKGEGLFEQLHFLYLHGWQLERLRQMAQEYAKTGGNP